MHAKTTLLISSLLASSMAVHAGLDLNGDGIITSAELIRGAGDAEGTYSSANAEIIPPQSTIVSEIEVEDDGAGIDVEGRRGGLGNVTGEQAASQPK